MSIFKRIRREQLKREYFEAMHQFNEMVSKYFDNWNHEWEVLYPNVGRANDKYRAFMDKKLNMVTGMINLTSYSKNLEYYVEDLEFKAREL